MSRHFSRLGKILSFITALLWFQQALGQSLRPVPARVQTLYNSSTSFEPVSLFKKADRDYYPAEEVVRRAQTLVLNMEVLADKMRLRPEYIRFELPYHDEIIVLDLYAAPVLSDGFSVKTSDGSPVIYTPGVYYRGIINGNTNSLATVSLFDDEVMAVISDDERGNMVLGRIDKPDNRDNYLLYEERQMLIPFDFTCTERIPDKPHDPPGPLSPIENVPGCTEIFLECDYALFDNKGSIAGTVNYVTGLFNQVATLYDNEDVSITISQIYIWVTPDNYPTNSSLDALNAFVALRDFFSGDLAHLLALGGNNVGGIAYLDVLCFPAFAYAYSNIDDSYENVPTYSWTIEVVAHELGHNFGSHHTHWCGWPGGPIDNCWPVEDGPCNAGPAPTNGGTVMSYCHLTGNGINFNNGFGPLPGDVLRTESQNASNGNCIQSSCPSFSCNPPTNITVSNITNSSAVITWNAVGGATSYNLQYRIVGNSNFTTVNNVTSPYTITGLSGDTEYEVQMQSVCGGNSSRYFVGAIFKTAASGCLNPSNLTASNITANSAQINWSENGGATEWEIEYGFSGFVQGSGTVVVTTNRPHTLTGLTHSMNYQVYVRSVCAGPEYSNWIGPLKFGTLLSNDLGANALEIAVGAACPGDSVYRNRGATTSGEYSPVYGNGGATGYWNTGISHTVWFKFTAPPSGAVRITTDIAPLGLSDSQVALYNTATPTTFTHYLASNEDGGSIGLGYAAVLHYCGLAPGTTYFIQVDGWNATQGSFCLEVHEDLSIGQPGNSCVSYSMQQVNADANKWYNIYTRPSTFNIGFPVAAIRTTTNLGTVTVQKQRYNSVQTAGNGVKYMQRYCNITSSLNQSGNKQVRLFYTDPELDALNVAAGASGTADDLNITHYDGINENCSLTDNNGVRTLISNVNATYIGNSGNFYLDFTAPGFSEFGAHFGFIPLPVELLSFTGETLQEGNRLAWTVASEVNVETYQVERTTGSFENWTAIGSVSPTTAAGTKTYRFVDDTAPAEAYYRLKATDLDDSYAYSPVVFLQRAFAGVYSISPNPAKNRLLIEYRSEAEDILHYRITNAEGAHLEYRDAYLTEGLNRLELDIATLPQGVYFLTLWRANGGLESRRFIKQ